MQRGHALQLVSTSADGSPGLCATLKLHEASRETWKCIRNFGTHTRFAKLHKITLNMPNLWGEITFFHRWIADEQSFTSRYIVFVLVHCAWIYVYAFMSISIYSYSIYIESHFALHFRYISVLSSRWNYNFQITWISLYAGQRFLQQRMRLENTFGHAEQRLHSDTWPLQRCGLRSVRRFERFMKKTEAYLTCLTFHCGVAAGIDGNTSHRMDKAKLPADICWVWRVHCIQQLMHGDVQCFSGSYHWPLDDYHILSYIIVQCCPFPAIHCGVICVLRIMQIALLSALILPDMAKLMDFSTSVGSSEPCILGHPGAIWRKALWYEERIAQGRVKTIQDQWSKKWNLLICQSLPVYECIADLHCRLACYHHVTAISGLDWFDHVHQHGALHSGTCRIVNDRCAPSLQIQIAFSFKVQKCKTWYFFCTAFFRVNDALKTALFLLCLHRVGLLSIGWHGYTVSQVELVKCLSNQSACHVCTFFLVGLLHSRHAAHWGNTCSAFSN